MQNIINNLMDVSWWFNIFFPVAIVALSPKLLKNLFKIIRINFRLSEAKFWIKNRHKRFDDLLVQKAMFSAQSAFNVFAIFVSVGLVILLTSNYVGSDKRNSFFYLIMVFPILASEIFWLVKDSRVDDLIKRRQRWLTGRKKAMRRASAV